MQKTDICPVCKSSVHLYSTGVDSERFDCPRCGEFDLTRSLIPNLQAEFDSGLHRRALMSHNLRRMQRSKEKRPLVTTTNVESFWLGEQLPSPQRQADDLILWVGDHQLAPEEPIRCAVPYLSAWLGTSILKAGEPTNGGLDWVCNYLADENLLETHSLSDNPVYVFRLKMAGWHKYEELKKTNSGTRTAFMAMKFGNEELNNVVEKCFRPAVSRTGFELRLLSDQQPAGLIDNQLRAALISARFVLCDLTHGNAGAYWEGGFAEGLGRQVFYTCQKDAWESQKTHFDTNHLMTIIWNASALTLAEDQLVAAIRATFRGDAKQTD
jgi:predicted RNA-binding Zn-ribbon protein involved in translation (DUF1610 family)